MVCGCVLGQELKRRAYNMLYERNAMGSKVQTLSGAKKKLESNTAKLLAVSGPCALALANVTKHAAIAG